MVSIIFVYIKRFNMKKFPFLICLMILAGCSKSLYRVVLIFTFLIGVGLIPTTLYGQTADSSYTIIGQAISRLKAPPSFPVRYTIDSGPGFGEEAILVADGDTLRTDLETSGEFSFSGIKAKQVTLTIVANGKRLENPIYHHIYEQHFSETIVLLPGVNYILILLNNPLGPLETANASVMTMNGDNWIYHFPEERSKRSTIIENLIGVPGVVYNKRAGTITISGTAVNKKFVNGAYIFALKLDAE